MNLTTSSRCGVVFCVCTESECGHYDFSSSSTNVQFSAVDLDTLSHGEYIGFCLLLAGTPTTGRLGG